MDAKIKPLSKEVTVMTGHDHGDLKDIASHSSTVKQVMWSSAFDVGDNILNQSHNYLIAVNAVQTSA